MRRGIGEAQPCGVDTPPAVATLSLGELAQPREVAFEPLSGVRRATARNMAAAWAQVPHVTQFDRADITQLDAMRRNPALSPELVYAWADEATLLRRYTETRRRHPLAPRDRVAAGIEIEQKLTVALRDAADLVIDTSDLPLARLRRQR